MHSTEMAEELPSTAFVLDRRKAKDRVKVAAVREPIGVRAADCESSGFNFTAIRIKMMFGSSAVV